MTGSLHPLPIVLCKAPWSLVLRGLLDFCRQLFSCAHYWLLVNPKLPLLTRKETHTPFIAGEQFVFVVLCSRNNFFSPRNCLAVCPLPNTHLFSAVGSPELWENKEVLAALPHSWSDRLTHSYHAGQETQRIREVHKQTWGHT